MKVHKKFIVLLFLGFVVFAILLYNGFVFTVIESVFSRLNYSTKFTGMIESANYGCVADLECSVIVNGKKVITDVGWNKNPTGKLVGVETINQYGGREVVIGKRVEVYARTNLLKSEFTLIGDDKYYIKALE